jgi:hypothetical protein
MSHDPKFNAAIAQEIVWKNPELQRFAVNLVRAALTKGGHFTTDIVPDDARGDGQGIAGSVVELLKSANVIQPVGHMHHGQWFAMRTKSTRPDRKSAWLCVYQLTSTALAEAFLALHGAAQTATTQKELFA